MDDAGERDVEHARDVADIRRMAHVASGSRDAILGGLSPGLVAAMHDAMNLQGVLAPFAGVMNEQFRSAVAFWQRVQSHEKSVKQVADAMGWHSGAGLSLMAPALAAAERDRVRAMRGFTIGMPVVQLESLAQAYRAFEESAVGAETLRGSRAALLHEFGSLTQVTSQTSSLRALIDGVVRAQGHLEARAMVERHKSARRIVRSLDLLSASVGRVWDDLARRPGLLESTSSAVREAPTLQLFSATHGTAAALTWGPPDEGMGTDDNTPLTDADAAVTAWLREGGDIAVRLENVRAGLGEAYAGAIHAYRQQAPDFIRHMTVSLRELLDKLIEELAPASAVSAWHTAAAGVPLYVPNTTRITRIARLTFLSRRITPTYAKFIVQDHRLIADTFEALNIGTHSVPTPLSPGDAVLLLTRVDGVLNTILRLADR